MKTPHLESLAAGGVTFRNAYCNNPICASSRFSMMAGQLPSRIGAYDNAAEFPAAVPTFAHYLRHLGYRTCLSGKMHFVGPDQLHGFEQRVTTDIYPSDFGWTPDWTVEDYPFAPSVMSMRGVVESGLCVRSLQIDYDEEVRYFAKRKLHDFAREANRPPVLPRRLVHPPAQPVHHHRGVLEPLPARRHRHAFGAHIPVDERDPGAGATTTLIRQDEHEVTDETVRRARHAYYGMISYVDDKVGELLDTLEALGIADDTVVVFTADHGDMMGERGMWFKFNPFEWSARVPLVVRAPGNSGAGWSPGNVSLVDLLPTFLDLATDGRPPEPADAIDGHSLAPMLYGPRRKLAGRGADRVHRRGHPCALPHPAQGALQVRLLRDRSRHVVRPGSRPRRNAEPVRSARARGDGGRHAPRDPHRAGIRQRSSSRSLESQRRRRFVQQVLLTGDRSPWDYQPATDASKQYVRSSITTSTTLTKGLARYPYMEPIPPDFPREECGQGRRRWRV